MQLHCCKLVTLGGVSQMFLDVDATLLNSLELHTRDKQHEGTGQGPVGTILNLNSKNVCSLLLKGCKVSQTQHLDVIQE